LVDATQLDEAAHVVGKVLHRDLRAGPHRGFGSVAALGRFGQRLPPFPLAVDVAGQLLGAHLILDLVVGLFVECAQH
jgi:hypothetical protein